MCDVVEAKAIQLKNEVNEILQKNPILNKKHYEDYVYNYWSEIFTRELEIVTGRAVRDSDLLKIPDEANMILTLGTSFEPLILAACLVKPGSIFVLYTDDTLLENFIKHINDKIEVKIKPLRITRDRSNPNEAATLFKLLRGKLVPDDGKEKCTHKELIGILSNDKERQKIIFDITGAKKTISGGCLLFASYYDIPVFYMDFNEDFYSVELGRPMPGACRYTRQSNPITGFRLKDLAEIESAFDDERYDEVIIRLGDIIGKIDKEYFNDQEIGRYKKILEIATVYSDWKGGWWGDVYDRIGELCGEQRCFIVCLENGKKKKHGKDAGLNKVGMVSRLLLEVAILKRRIEKNDDARDIFFKSYTLEEVLLKFMVKRLYDKDIIKVKNGITDEKKILAALGINFDGKEGIITGKRETDMTRGWFGEVEFYLGNNIPEKLKLLVNEFKIFNEDRPKRNDVVHYGIPIEHNMAKGKVEAMEKLLKETIRNSDFWFESTTIPEEFSGLLQKQDWHKEKAVSPMKWNEVA